MDDAQRAQLGQQIRSAREARGLSQAELATRAGIATNTVAAMERGNAARPASLGKVLAALDIEAVADVAARNGLPPEVQFVSDIVAQWMLGMPQSEWANATLGLVRYLGTTATAKPHGAKN